MMSGGARELTMDDALTYIKAVKITLQNEREKYESFLNIINNIYDPQRNNKEDVIPRVKELFKEHRGLLFGFNVFLPMGHEIKLPLENEQSPLNESVEIEEALTFLNKVKTRFQGGGGVYNSFIDILRTYRSGKKSIAEVYWKVAVLFQDHIDLLHEFNKLLPTTVKDPVMQLSELMAKK